MMRKTALWGLVFLVMFVAGHVPPVSAAGAKIGIIDLKAILQKSKAAKDARGIFLMDLESKRTVLRAKEAEVRKMQAELRQKASGKSAEQLREQQDKLAQEIKELRRLKADLEEELKKKDSELTRKLLSDIRDVVVDFRKKKNFTLILEKKSVLAYDEAVDITDDIIEAFDRKNR